MLFSLVALVVYAVVCVGILLGSYYFLDILTPGKLTMIIKEGGWNAPLSSPSWERSSKASGFL